MATWVRVRDDATGHEFDVEQSALDNAEGVTPVKGYPTVSGDNAQPRPTKFRTAKGGSPAAPRAPRKRAVKKTTSKSATTEAGSSATPKEK